MVRIALAPMESGEVTFQEVRTHLGVETQRQWSDRAVARTTPVLFGLFSWISLAAHMLQEERPAIPRAAAWYAKSLPTPMQSGPTPSHWSVETCGRHLGLFPCRVMSLT